MDTITAPNVAPVLGPVSTPDGQVGQWRVETFEVSEAEANLHNLRCDLNRQRLFRIRPGIYRRLVHERGLLMMSNTPMEVWTNREALRQARGKVLINGLGLGMLLEAILAKPEVTEVRVIEKEADVIALVGPGFAHDPRVTIVHADALTYRPAKGERFDYVWHDIWPEITADNLPEMTRLARKYGRRTARQGFWARDLIVR